MIAAASDDPGADAGDGADGREAFAAIRSDPGNVSLNTAKAEVAKLASITAIGLPGRLFAGIAPRVLAGWRARKGVLWYFPTPKLGLFYLDDGRTLIVVDVIDARRLRRLP